MKRFSIGTKYEYCPNGNYWQDISGLFDKEFYLFCDCDKCGGKVYKLKAIDYTKKVTEEVIQNARNWNKLEDIRGKITLKNMNEIANKLK